MRIGQSGAFKVDGLEELTKNLREIPKIIRNRVVRKASYKASRIPIAKIRENIATLKLIDTGTMQKRIGPKVVYRRRTDQIVLMIGAIFTQGKTKEDRQAKRTKLGITRDPYYIRFQELGTKYLEARHFVQDAFMSTREAYVSRFVEECKLLIPIEVAKGITHRKVKK